MRDASPAQSTATELPAELAATGAYIPAERPTPPASSGSFRSSAERFDRAAAMIADVADALHHAHQCGITHRDVKPSNLLLASDGRLSVTDFGLARLLEQPGMTVTGEFVGTPAYMSPEQIAAGRVPLDHRTDIYSLGATLYELLTLRPPFAADGRDKLLAMIIQKEPPSPRSLDAKIPRDLETICLKCLEKDPDRRYANAKDLANDLRRYLNRFAILARRVGPLGKFRKWTRRNPALAAAGLIALLALVSTGLLAWRSHEAEQRRLAEERKRDDEMRLEKLHTAMDRAMTAAMAVDIPAADKAVDEAELLGASLGEVRMLRGFVEYQNGQPAKALAHLQQAANLMPGSMSARALLARVLAANLEWAAAFRTLDEAAALTPRTPEDSLLLGHALAVLGQPADGLKLIDGALVGRPSGIGHLLRADARISLAVRTGTVDSVETALTDAEFIQTLLQGSEYSHASMAFVRMWAAAKYRRAGRMDKWDEHLAAAIREADALARFPNNQDAIFTRITVANLRDGLAGQSDMSDELHRAQSIAPNGGLACEEAMNLFVLSRDQEAAKVAGQFPGHRSNRFVRFLIALGRRDGRTDARGLLEPTIADTSMTPRYRVEAAIMFNAVGSPEEVAAAVRTIPTGGTGAREAAFTEDQLKLIQYLEGRLSEADLLRRKPANDVTWDAWDFAIAWKNLGSGDHAGAEAAFRRVYERMTFSGPWWISRGVLIRMKKDPTWPKWIAEKKEP